MPRLGRSAGRQGANYALRPPVVVDAAVVLHGPGVKLAAPLAAGDIERRHSSWLLRPPTVVDAAAAADVFPGPAVELARANPRDPRRKAQYDLAAPIVVFPGGQMGGIGVSLADARNARSDGRRAPNSFLSKPAVLGAVAPFVADLVRVARAEPHRPAPVLSKLRPPTVVGTAITFRPLAVALTEPHKPAPTHSELRVPAVVNPPVVSRPLQVHLVPSHRPAPTQGILRAPTVLDPASTYPPVRSSLAEPRKPRLVQSQLQSPAVVDIPAQPPTDVSVDVTLAPSRDVARRTPKPELRPPVVVGPAIVYPSVSTTLVPQPRQARAAHSTLSPPAVVAEQFFARAITVSLTPSSNLARRTHPELRSPSVVGPAQIYGPVKVELVPSPRQARGTHPRLRAPTVVGAVLIFRAIKVTLVAPALQMHRHGSAVRLSPPTDVIQPSDVIFIDYYDHPKPGSALSTSPRQDSYENEPGSAMQSSPGTGAFDTPKPIGEVD